MYQSVVCDVVYVDLKLEDDVIKPRVLDDEWWKKSFAISKLVWPLVRLLKVTDSMLPTMSKIVWEVAAVRPPSMLVKATTLGKCAGPEL